MNDTSPHCLTPARILLCDDQNLIRTRVREVLIGLADFQVIGEATDGKAAVRMTLELRPDIVLMDVSMPELDGVEATRQILAQAPGIHVVAYSAESDESTVRRMMAAGARSYVLKAGDPTELLTALKKALKGEHFASESPPGNRSNV